MMTAVSISEGDHLTSSSISDTMNVKEKPLRYVSGAKMICSLSSSYSAPILAFPLYPGLTHSTNSSTHFPDTSFIYRTSAGNEGFSGQLRDGITAKTPSLP